MIFSFALLFPFTYCWHLYGAGISFLGGASDVYYIGIFASSLSLYDTPDAFTDYGFLYIL